MLRVALAHILLSITAVIWSVLPAHAERLKVVTSFTVIADMASQVAGDAADVVSITKPGAEIHGYQPTPGDLVRAKDADLILWNGLNLELWFEQFIRRIGDIPSVTLTEGITPIAIASGAYQGRANPHAWMGYQNALIYIDNIAAALADADAGNAAIYAENAARYKAELSAVITPLKQAVNRLDEDKKWLVSCEGAFSYLAADFGLRELYLWPMNAEQTGTPQQIRKVIDGVRRHNIPVVFCESTVNTSPAEQVAKETDAMYGGVLYVDSLSASDGPVPTYLDLLRVTSATIVRGLNEDSAEK